MKVIFTCGGTAGHVNPALALAGYMRKQDPTVEILFVGTPNGIERGLVAEAGYDYRGIEVGSFERSMDLDSLRHNAKSAVELLTLRRRAQAILREFPADLVVGTGGYASYPMVKYAALQGIPTAVHEANMIPGLTTRMLEKHAARIMVGFEECRIHYKHPERIVVTGTPVRGDFFDMYAHLPALFPPYRAGDQAHPGLPSPSHHLHRPAPARGAEQPVRAAGF